MMRIVCFGLAMIVTMGCQSSRARQREFGPPPGAFARPGAPVPVAQGFGSGPGSPVPVAPGQGFASGQGFAPAPGTPVPMAPGGPTEFGAPGAASPFPTAPQGPSGAPNFAPPGGPAPAPMAPSGPAPQGGFSGPTGKIESNWLPADARTPSGKAPQVLLAPPEPTPGETKEAPKQLYPPQVDQGLGKAAPLPATSFPVAIPQFGHVKANVAAGLRPALDDGFDWLQTNKYRTVLHVRLPGENDEADRKHAEKRGLSYQSLEISPLLLTKDTVEDFFKLVRDPEQQPVFVYDRDGALAGGLWYLWFRLEEQSSDEVARIRARSLGLREDREGAHRDMWQSVQKYVSETKSP